MTDEELVAVLRWRGSALQEGAFPAAADRIEALTAERDEMAMSCLSADGEAQRAWDAQKAAEAELDRLKLDVAQFQRVNDGLQDMLNKSKEVGFAFDNLAEVTAEHDGLREALQFFDDLGNNGGPGVKAHAALKGETP